MVFSSIPAYLDPSNWQQQPNHHQVGSSGGGANHHHHQLPPPPPQPQLSVPQPSQPHVGGGGPSGSIRPGSMADRARMANIPFPETALKCPRCESTNTKFCYFNNYSLSQPRHFCKTCRRYWTRGGALRNVPVGGGCRRNKRSKGSGGGSSSKSPASSGGGDNRQTGPNSSSGVSHNSGTASLLGLSSQIPTFPFMANLHQFGDYGEIGLNYSGISAPMVAGGGSGGGYLSTGSVEQWRLQQPQLPLLGGLDVPSGLLYPFQSGIESSNYVGEGSQIRPKLSESGLSQMGSVKMEDNQEMGLSRQFLGINPGNNDQFWNGGTTGTAWTDLSGFSTSSSSNPL